jgi:hypothetical protein
MRQKIKCRNRTNGSKKKKESGRKNGRGKKYENKK